MHWKSLLKVLLVFAALISLGTAPAYAGPAESGGDLIYSYYAFRGASNYMVVNDSDSTAPCTMAMPAKKQAFTYTPVETPVVDCDPAKAKPVGVGNVAKGGDVLDLNVEIGPFEEPVDVSFGLFAASFDAADIYFLNILNQFTSLQDQISEDNEGQGQGKAKKKFKKLPPWKSNVLEVSETIGPVDVSDLPPGLYVVVLNVTRVSPADDNFDRFYRWVTYFIIPDRPE